MLLKIDLESIIENIGSNISITASDLIYVEKTKSATFQINCDINQPIDLLCLNAKDKPILIRNADEGGNILVNSDIGNDCPSVSLHCLIMLTGLSSISKKTITVVDSIRI